jgi:recombination protein RecA
MNDKAREAMERINATMAKKFKKNPPELTTGADLPIVEWISTGLLAYDWLNGGGAPRSHIEQIYGRKSSGKTSVCLSRIAACQRQGGVAAFVDVEHTLDKLWAQKLGVNMNDLILHEPYDEAGERTLDLVINMLEGGDIDMIVVDSVPPICPEAMMTQDMDQKHYGGNSGLFEQFFKKIIGTGILYNSNCVLIFINQPRAVIGSRIPLERLPGGNSLQHYSSIMTEVKRGDYIMSSSAKDADKVGVEVKLINQKNKVRWPYKETTLKLQFATGFNVLWDLVTFAQRYDIIETSGAWGYYNGEQIGNGVGQQMQWLMEHKELYFEMKNQIQELIRAGK